jgi:hypothetical protein
VEERVAFGLAARPRPWLPLDGVWLGMTTWEDPLLAPFGHSRPGWTHHGCHWRVAGTKDRWSVIRYPPGEPAASCLPPMRGGIAPLASIIH